MVSRKLGEHLRTNGVEKKFSLRPLNIKNTQNLIEFVQK